MGKRNDDGTWEDSCLAKLKPGEPFFVLRAQDMLAADLVRDWAYRAQYYGAPKEKIKEAMDTAREMQEWAPRKFPD